MCPSSGGGSGLGGPRTKPRSWEHQIGGTPTSRSLQRSRNDMWLVRRTDSDRPIVLIADDDAASRRLIELWLEGMGVRTLAAADGVGALALARAGLPDLALLDVMMPGLDGFEVARELKRDPAVCGTPIVMITSLGDVDDRVRALDAGADDFLSKPVDPAELQSRVRSLLKTKALGDRLREHERELEAAVEAKTADLQAALDRAEMATLDTIQRLSRAAEYRDEATGAHITRVSHYAYVIARGLGEPDAWCRTVMHAMPMHDVGKIGIPDRILLKPGKLDADESAVMRTHARIGASILSGSSSDVLQTAEIIALTHHERWDGTGYPAALAGEEIPLAGRIAAIVDVFDAVCSKRPYKSAVPPADAARIVESERGAHFDPDVADAFVLARDELLSFAACAGYDSA
ncbi:MAG: response regulator [Actinobacteria bacterium]|nr:MAG: response regulator [Actinomycetota bacterium]